MGDWALIAVRWSLYIDLGLLFGLPLFRLYALHGEERDRLLPLRGWLGALAGIGLAMSALGFLLTAAAMMGGGLMDVDRATLLMLITETNMGWALMARLAGLSAVLVLVAPRRPLRGLPFAATIAAAAVIVGSLAWAGHGAATDGLAGMLQLGGDLVHVAATSSWIGAIAGFILILAQSRTAGPASLHIVHRALASFSTVGAAVVSLITLTGLLNALFLIGPSNISALLTTLYGRLLVAKLILFAAMLLLAASNRFRLTPALSAAIEQGATESAELRLRRSLWFEISAGMMVLALVAWVGTLAPPSSMN